MSSLLSNLDKKPFQAYTIEHGIEKIKVKIPLSEVKIFEEAFEVAVKNGASKSELLAIVKNSGGSERAEAKSK